MARRSTGTASAERGSGTSDTETAPPVRRGKEARRREILDAAAEVFLEKGYDASSTQEIADKVGILKGSLYYYVTSKEDFLYEIIRETHTGAVRAIEPVLAMETDGLHRLANLILRQVEFFTANRTKSVVFFREYRALSAERRAEIEPEGERYRAMVGALLADGQQDGTISADLDVRMTSMAIVEMLNSVHRWFRSTGRVSAARLGRDMAAMLCLGVASQAAIEAHGGADKLREKIENGWGRT
ncbi:TetR/AcrR family transcriptional regulator [Actinophytocola oryzae]|uniref:TetR family transcriptional regulator n=1 Tax=Actinophytocola oryzae TaxID=502181 RepID=A0A4R7W2I3_9PSEU|nr:TetR/AcrR family transcriptional regulator [Actinophytocola oryzae]TDV56228.1 TetR family transcriptional regulator [Actinophytocola oryzae]